MDKNTLLLVTNNGLGRADIALQHKLATKYFALLLENGTLPGAIAFYTDGVKLIVDGSPVLESLSALEKCGVTLIVCSTCLEYYGLSGQVKVGIVGGMPDIIEAQVRAEKVISL